MNQAEAGFDRVRYSILPGPGREAVTDREDTVYALGSLRVRVLQPRDQLDLFCLEGNPNVLRYAHGKLLDYAQAGDALERFRRDATSSDAELRVFAASADHHPFLGTVATVHHDTEIEIDFRLLECHWNQGWGHKLGALAVSLARHLYPTHLLVGHCDLQDEAGLRIADHLAGHRQPDTNTQAHWHWHP